MQLPPTLDRVGNERIREVTMPDLHNIPEGLQESVLEGGERLDDSEFEGEAPMNLNAESLEGDSQ